MTYGTGCTSGHHAKYIINLLYESQQRYEIRDMVVDPLTTVCEGAYRKTFFF